MILLIPLIFAGLIAILGYRYIAPSQPEYPNARVITTFTLLGGSVGGVLLALAFWWLGDISRSYFDGDGDALLSLLYVGVLLGLPSCCGVRRVAGEKTARPRMAKQPDCGRLRRDGGRNLGSVAVEHSAGVGVGIYGRIVGAGFIGVCASQGAIAF